MITAKYNNEPDKKMSVALEMVSSKKNPDPAEC